ncbi:uncharacterized protein LOC129948207 [Eupeodes corollae]|uniref:uncharacterized protein LOC129948207 n=1 Tax=Eupeodes corollae TaxID=290404 RepID=UPI0024906B1B|nr:uncharacterized protein LOC129948207 [Eupeodes corollae]
MVNQKAIHELFYNPISNTGYLVNKIKNINVKRHKCDGTYGQSKSIKLSQSLDVTIENIVLEQEDKEFFDNCLAVEQEEAIKERLLKTLEARKNILKKSIDIFKEFKFFTFNSNLILYDFSIRYPGTEQLFLNQWKNYANVAKEIFVELFEEKSIKEIGDWNQEISSFLLLLRMLPSTSQGPKSREKKRSNFENSIPKLIKFEHLNTPRENYDLSEKQPHIIAVGANKQAVSQYLIVFDKTILPCASTYNFCQIFDLYFKIFYVFNIEFDYS